VKRLSKVDTSPTLRGRKSKAREIRTGTYTTVHTGKDGGVSEREREEGKRRYGKDRREERVKPRRYCEILSE
jgi:hypothetical protein